MREAAEGLGFPFFLNSNNNKIMLITIIIKIIIVITMDFIDKKSKREILEILKLPKM